MKKTKRLGEKVTGDKNIKYDRRSFKVPGTEMDVNICVQDSNCPDEKVCRNLSCVSGEDGEYCNVDDDCKSKLCKAIHILGKCVQGTVCISGLPDGEQCCRDADCTTGYCNSFLECGRRSLGQECNKSKDCLKAKCSADNICEK